MLRFHFHCLHPVVNHIFFVKCIYTLPTFNPFVLSAYEYHIISIKRLHALGVGGVEAAQIAVQENQMLHPTGNVIATEEAIIAGEFMATGEAEVQSVQAMHDGRVIASQDHASLAGHLTSSSLDLFQYLLPQELDHT